MILSNKYHWNFCSLGGVTRVRISSGEDIAHLDELDPKLWTVLSCPVDGLYFDRKTLEILDSDKDGRIRIDEVGQFFALRPRSAPEGQRHLASLSYQC